MPATIQVVIDDLIDSPSRWTQELDQLGFRVERCSRQTLGLGELESRDGIAAVLVDLPPFLVRETIELVQESRRRRPDLPVVVLLDPGQARVAPELVREGISGLMTRNGDVRALAGVLERVLASPPAVRRLADETPPGDLGDALLGDSEVMRRLRDHIARVAASDAGVLITGESGTGKELIARAIHASSARAERPLVAVNCGAIPETLLENELFGHVKGAYTDAVRPQPGLFVQATGGTLFLDEIGELPLSMQPKLLRALQERRVRPVGGDSEVDVDVRVIAATHRDLVADVAAGRFRSDLFYRLDVVRLHAPSLSERPGDAVQLAERFLAGHAARLGRDLVLAPAAARLIEAYHWPGNVRQLENCIEHAVALSSGPEIGINHLPAALRTREAPAPRLCGGAAPISLDEAERRHIDRVIAACGGNKTRAAHVLGIARRSLYRRLQS